MDSQAGREYPYGPVCAAPVRRAAMVHGWDELTFLHWSYPATEVQRLLPAGLEVETFDGSAWVGLVPFFLRVGVPGVDSIPWVSRFAETNVRTYVRSAEGERGIWFFSLDAARLGAVLVARATYRLPYFWSRMQLARVGNTLTYSCRRRWPGPRGAASDAVIEIGEVYAEHDLTELDHFLTALVVVQRAAQWAPRRAGVSPPLAAASGARGVPRRRLGCSHRSVRAGRPAAGTLLAVRRGSDRLAAQGRVTSGSLSDGSTPRSASTT